MAAVLSFGGGVNSTAMLLLLADLQQLPDLVLFADTGGERPATYDHVREMRTWCIDHAVPFHVVRNGVKTLEQVSLDRKELPSLAYGFKGCSVKFKRQPMDRYIRDNWAPAAVAWAQGELVTRYIGIDAGETRRAKLPPDNRYVYRYPLVEHGVDRDGCLALIKKHGLTPPPKSSCFFCPALRKPEILALAKDHPDLFARAVAIEKNAVTRSVAGLGRRFAWGDFVAGTAPQVETAPPPPCDCMDDDAEDQ